MGEGLERWIFRIEKRNEICVRARVCVGVHKCVCVCAAWGGRVGAGGV